VDSFIQSTVDKLMDRGSQGVIVTHKNRKDFINSKKLAYKARSNVHRGRSTQMSTRSRIGFQDKLSPRSQYSSKTPLNRETDNFFAFKLKADGDKPVSTPITPSYMKTDPEKLIQQQRLEQLLNLNAYASEKQRRDAEYELGLKHATHKPLVFQDLSNERP
jgi:hypothetical protein